MWEPLGKDGLGVVILGIFLVICIIYSTHGLRAMDSKFTVHPIWYHWCHCFGDEEMHNSLSSSHSLSHRDTNMKVLILLNKCSRIRKLYTL